MLGEQSPSEIMKPTFKIPSFPDEIEDWWWKQTIQKWPELSEEKIINLIRKEIVLQSDRFNKSRTFEPQSYGSRDLSVFAYGNFFFPRTWKAMSFALAEAYSFRGWTKPQKGPIRILDIGSGSGASGLSVLYLLRELGIDNRINLEAWDYSGKSLAMLKNLHRKCFDLWKESKVETKRLDLKNNILPLKKQRFDLILLGYSMNEILEGFEEGERLNWILQIKSLLSTSGFALFVEPAQMEICNALQFAMATISSKEKDIHIHAPYFNNSSCPFLSNQKSHYYSHEVRKISSSPRVEKICGPLKLETNQVKFGFSILGKQEPKEFSKDYSCCRLVSPIRKKKGTVSFIGIATDGEEYMYEFQRRHLTPDQTKILTKFERGDIVNINNAEKGNDPKRIRVSSFDDLHCIFSPRWDN